MDSQCQQNTLAPTHALGGEWVRGNLQGQCTANLGFAASPYPSGSLTGLSLPDTWPMLRSLLYETLSIGSVNTRDTKDPNRRLDGWGIGARALGSFGKPIARAGPCRHIHQLTQRVAAAGQA
jgi:hypothetical protein